MREGSRQAHKGSEIIDKSNELYSRWDFGPKCNILYQSFNQTYTASNEPIVKREAGSSGCAEGEEPKSKDRDEWQPLAILVALSAAVVLLSLADLDTSAPYVAGQETVFLPDTSPALA